MSNAPIEISEELFFDLMEICRLAPIYVARDAAVDEHGVNPDKWYRRDLEEDFAEKIILAYRKLLHVGNDQLMDGELDLPEIVE